MSHELRTPLNAVIGFTDLLASCRFGPLTERQGNYVRDIGASGRHLLGLINTVLDMSKIEAGRYEVAADDVDIRSLFDEALTLARARADESGIVLHRSLSGDALLRADRRKLLQVLLNLLTNAIKFTERGGSVTLTAALAEDGCLTFTVADTGKGIAPGRLAHIFEPFQSGDEHLSRDLGGTGLGLSISKMLMEMHGGTLSIESAVGEGTTVTARLPADRIIHTDGSPSSARHLADGSA